MRPQRIVITAAQVPFHAGGAEWHVRALHRQLVSHGFACEVAEMPFQWSPRVEALKSALAWRLVDLTESNGVPVDLLIGTKFPSYAARHPRKVVWLFHQFRQAYDLHEAGVDGFPKTAEGEDLRHRLVEMDTQILRECRRIYTTSRNNAARLRRYNGLDAEVLRLPLLDPDTWRCEGWESFVLSVGRLDRLKRTELLLRAAAHLPPGMRTVIVGQGPLRADLERLAASLGVADRVEFLGYVDDAGVKDLYSRCSAVYYAPFDEDYGLVTLEALHSRKPVVTTVDSGGPLEFVEHGTTGFVTSTEPAAIAAAIARLLEDKARAREMGARGYEAVQGIRWDDVIEKLTSV